MIRLPLFSGKVEQVAEFVTACKLYIDETERKVSKEVDTVGINIYIRKISRYMKRELVGRNKSRGSQV